jgi:hypothetical protein
MQVACKLLCVVGGCYVYRFGLVWYVVWLQHWFGLMWLGGGIWFGDVGVLLEPETGLGCACDESAVWCEVHSIADSSYARPAADSSNAHPATDPLHTHPAADSSHAHLSADKFN